MKPSSLDGDARVPARDRQRKSTPPQVKPTSTSVRQFDAASRRLRAARPPAERATRGGALGRVKYTLPIEGRGSAGHRVTQAWLDSLAQSDASSAEP